MLKYQMLSEIAGGKNLRKNNFIGFLKALVIGLFVKNVMGNKRVLGWVTKTFWNFFVNLSSF